MTATNSTPPIRHPDRLFIGGKWLSPSGSKEIDVHNSGTEELFLTVAEATAADVNAAVDSARDAFDRGPWPQLSHIERAEYLKAIGRELRARAPDFARSWTIESGVIHSVSTLSAHGLAGTWDYYAAAFPSLNGTSPPQEARSGFLSVSP
jgi:acyl-CoA reductase-like NAD-dependent aldehyde dehydrogenase